MDSPGRPVAIADLVVLIVFGGGGGGKALLPDGTKALADEIFLPKPVVVDPVDLRPDLLDVRFVFVSLGPEDRQVDEVGFAARLRSGLHGCHLLPDRIGYALVILLQKKVRNVILVVPEGHREIEIVRNASAAGCPQGGIPRPDHLEGGCFAFRIHRDDQPPHPKDVVVVGDPFREDVVVVLDEQAKGGTITTTTAASVFPDQCRKTVDETRGYRIRHDRDRREMN